MFDLNSAYYLYDVNATVYPLYRYQYQYYYNCWNEVMNIPYEDTCNTTIIGNCKRYSNVFPYPTGDCMGLQKRFLEISSFVPTDYSATCITKSAIQPRLSGTIRIGNDTTIFDTMLEIGRLSSISNNMKINLISDIEKRGMIDVCRRMGNTNSKIVLDLIKGYDIEKFISRRIVDGHLITNFQESLLPYEIDDDLLVNQKGVFYINDTKYFFLYYFNKNINGTTQCTPIPYGDDYVVVGNNLLNIDGSQHRIYVDRNCTERPNPIPTGSPTLNACNNGFSDNEGNVFCYDSGYLVLYTGKVVSQEIQDEFMIQISYKGNYKAKQVFYDRCRIRDIKYINNTIFIYDCDDYVHIKNKYTNRVYKVKSGLNIILPDGIYYLADFVSSPLLYVINSVETPTMYYAKDKFYSNIVIGFGLSIDVIERKTTYITFYALICIVALVMISCIIAIVKCRHNIICKRSKYAKVSTEVENKKPMKKKSMKQKVASKMSGK